MNAIACGCPRSGGLTVSHIECERFAEHVRERVNAAIAAEMQKRHLDDATHEAWLYEQLTRGMPT